MSSRRHTWLLVLVILASATFASAEPEGEEERLDPVLKLLYRAQLGAPKIQGRATAERERALEVVGLLQTAKADAPPPSSLLLLLQFEGEERRLEEIGFKVQSRVGTIYSGVLDPGRLPELAGLSGVGFVEISRPLRHLQQTAPRLPYAAIEPNLFQASLPPGAPAVPPGAGAGVLVAFIDSGVDIRHQDFRNPDGTTRIELLLDLSDPGDFDSDGLLDGPDDLGGTLYTREEINRALRGSGSVRERDTTGHGTHGLSIAAGDDPRYPGMAPGATLLVVKATRRDGTLDFESADLLSALSFVDRKAAELGMPYVVNLSLGTSYGPHDGRTAEELAIDALVGPGIPGKAVVLAAGNSADRGGSRYRHFQGTAFTGLETQHTLTIPEYSAPRSGVGKNTVLLDLWYEGEDRLAIRVTAPDGTTTVEAAYGDFVDVATPYGQVFIANLGGRNPRNGDTEAVVLLYDKAGQAPAAGFWTISVRGEAVSGSGVYHGWLVDGASRVGDVEPFLSAGADNEHLIARPAAAAHGITVGSFARHDPANRFRTTWTDVRGIVRTDVTARSEEISAFSSPGMTRDGRLKPELTAPGEQVMGAVSRDAYPGVSPHSLYAQHPFAEPEALILAKEPDAAFGMMQGTSFSAPVITGIVARLLAVAPSLDAIQIRNLLLNSALTDDHTGQVPNASWGWGKAALSLATRSQDPLPSPLRMAPDLLPSGVVGRQYNQILSALGGTSPYSWALTEGRLPPGLTLEPSGYITGTPMTHGEFEATILVVDSSSQRLSSKKLLRVIEESLTALEITTPFLPLGEIGGAYRFMLQAAGGLPPYYFALEAGKLPQGLSLSANGLLEGTPLLVGKQYFTIRVQDSRGTYARRSFAWETVFRDGGDWLAVGALNSAFISLLEINSANSDHLIAGTRFSTGFHILFESFDGGHSWRRISLNNGLTFAGSVAINPTRSEVWAIERGGLYPFPLRYDPAQNRWVPIRICDLPPITSSPHPTGLVDLRFDASGNALILPYNVECAGDSPLNTLRGFLLSKDSGRSWRNIGVFPGSIYNLNPRDTGDKLGFLSVFRADSRHLYAMQARMWPCCTGGRVEEEFYSSHDGGATWTSLPITIETVSVPHVSQSDPLDVVRAPWIPENRFGQMVFPWEQRHPGSSVIERSLDGGLSWTPLLLPNNSRVCMLSRSASNPSTMLVGAIGGLFKTKDGGQNWEEIFIPNFSSNFCESGVVAIDPNNSDIFIVGAKENTLAISRDGGRSWRLRSQELISRDLTGISVSRSRPSELLVSSGFPYVSRTGGDRWTLSREGISEPLWFFYNTHVSQPLISPKDPRLFFFLNSSSYLYRSQDAGLTWAKLTPVFFYPNGTRVEGGDLDSVVADPFDGQTLVARGRPQGSSEVGIWRSQDRGVNWHEVGNLRRSNFSHAFTSGEQDLAFADDAEGHLYALETSGLYESKDKGSSWSLVGKPINEDSRANRLVVEAAPNRADRIYMLISSESSASLVGVLDRGQVTGVANWKEYPKSTFLSSVAIDPVDSKIAYVGVCYFQRGGWIEKTVDGGSTWSPLTGFPQGLNVVSLVTHPTNSGVVYAATAEDGAYRSEDGGLTWKKLDNYGAVADIVNVAVKDPANPNLLFAGTQGFGVQVSTDGGQNFVPRNEGLTNLNVTSLAFDPGSPLILYAGTEDGLFKTTDSGTTWLPTAFADGLVTDISVVGGARPRMIRITTLEGGFAFSQDEGRSFNILRPSLGASQFTSIETEGRDAGTRLWLTLRGGEGVAVSDDGGRTWRSAAGSGLTDRNVNDLLVEPGDGRVWIATDSGVFATNDAGRTWTEISAGLPPGVPVTSLSLDHNTREIFVSLSDERNGGIFRGGNVRGAWTAFNDGLPELRINKLTNDGGHPLSDRLRGTTFYAATEGSGFFSNEVLASGVAGAGPRITTTALLAGSLGEKYSATLTATGGADPYFWTLASGSLPPGLGLDANSGRVTGLPVRGGFHAFTVQVADASSRTASKELSIQVRDSASFLNIETAGAGSGMVRSSPAGIDCGTDCGEEFAEGTAVTLSAEPARDSRFVGWTGAGCSGTGPCRLTASGLKTVTATFTKAGPTLTVRKAGDGDGRVISSPPGIDCGRDCDEAYPPGTRVRLQASSASGSVFQGWTGKGCSGQGDCLVTLRGTREVTATFTRRSRAATTPHQTE